MSSAHVFDVRDYGADPTGVHDSARAIQSAMSFAARAGGGSVFLASGTYLCRSVLRADGTTGVRLEGEGSETPGSQPASALRYTGRGDRFISARSSMAFGLRGLGIFADNEEFTGVIVDLSRAESDARPDSAFALIEDCVIMGGNLLTNAGAAISLDRAITSTIRNCNLGNAQTAIRGRTDDATSYSNAIQIYSCHLTHTAVAHISNPGSAWIVEGCTFSALADGRAGAIQCEAVAGALSVIGCWMGDVTSDSGSTWILFHGGGLSVMGNSIGGNQSSTTAISFVGGANRGIDIRANVFDGHLVGVDVGPGQSDITVQSNAFFNVAMEVAGTL
jgi:hypothetical protein